jgi:hypothetical protein
MKKANKRVRAIFWVCDKRDCKTTNSREIPSNIVLNDDVCDFCHKRIHEPILIDKTNDRE